MIKSDLSHYKPFQSIPKDLKAHIFEYLTLIDYANLSLVCQSFNSFIKKSQNLWTKHLFRDFLDVRAKGAPFNEGNTSPGALTRRRGDVIYSEMINSKELLIDHQYIKLRWKSFFEAFLPPQVAQTFVNEAVYGLKSPSYPPPCLKKDVHYFPTNTLFQNLLTEAHFGIQGRSFFQEKKQALMERIAEKMKANLLERETDTEDLIILRWYLFNSEQEDQRNPLDIQRGISLSDKSKETKKNELSLRRGTSLRENLSILNKPRPARTSKSSKSAVSIRGKSNIKASRSHMKKRTEDGEESEVKQAKVGEDTSSDNEEPCVEEFYWMLHNLVENHCKMVVSYLKAVQDPYLLLSEYTRLWNKFVLLIIDFSQTFNPFADLFNKLYEEECKNLPNYPEFSTWRLMVRIWVDQVFSNLSYYLGEGFRSILMKIRGQGKALNIKFSDTEKCDFCLKANMTKEGPDSLYSQFFYKSKKSGKEKIRLSKDELVKLLKDFYNTVHDISYNEYTIFYWDCDSAGKKTPKGVLDSMILQDTTMFYDSCKECFLHDSEQFREFLNKDNKLLGSVMGKPFSWEARKTQLNFLRGALSDMFFNAMKEAEATIEFNNAYRKMIPKQNGENEACDINLMEAVRVLCIEEEEEVQEKVINSEENRNIVGSVLAKDSKLFNSYLLYLGQEEEEIEEQTQEFEEMKDHRQLRGFVIINEEYNQFFELGENVRLSEIKRIGIEGKNIKEEIECMDDMLIFL